MSSLRFTGRVAALAGTWMLLATGAFAADAKGTWWTADKDSQVRITDCGSALCGSIVWLKEPNDPATGKPKTDKNNTEEAKKGRPLMGVQIVLGMKPAGSDKWQGDVYNAADGKTYSGSVTMMSPAKLKLEGCFAKIFCKSQEWSRVN